MAPTIAKMIWGVSTTSQRARAARVRLYCGRPQLNELRAEVAKFKRQAAQEREVAEGSTHAQLEQLKRLVRSVELRLPQGTALEGDSADGHLGNAADRVFY